MSLKHLFSSPFRAWFFSGSLFASLLILPWVAQFLMPLNFQPLHGLFWWHQHEMVFAIAVPFILGFLLTASQNWTGESPIGKTALIISVGIWWLARLSIASNMPLWLCVGLELFPLLFSTYLLTRLLVRHNNRRNLIMVALLCLMAIANLFEMVQPAQVTQWAHFSVLIIILFIVIFGGRVIPFFTASGAGVPKVNPNPLLERGLLSSQILATLLLPFAPHNPYLQVLAAFVATLQLWRWLRWQCRPLWRKPLLWSLHIAYLNIIIGWYTIAWRGLDSFAVHSLAIGGIGMMILAFAGRISLAHSGRPLIPSGLFTVSLLFIAAAVIFRVWLPILFNIDSVSLRYTSSGLIWAVGYAVFTALYSKVWFTARADGKPH